MHSGLAAFVSVLVLTIAACASGTDRDESNLPAGDDSGGQARSGESAAERRAAESPDAVAHGEEDTVDRVAGGESGASDREARDRSPVGSAVSPAVFGVNVPWPNRGNFIMQDGELVRDRSFREGETFWTPVVDGQGRVEFYDTGGTPVTGDADPSGGHALLTARNEKSLVCVYQELFDLIDTGAYTATFSTRPTTGTPTILVRLTDAELRNIADEGYGATVAGNWERHSVQLEVTRPSYEAKLGVCVGGAAQVDEIRLSATDRPPVVKGAVKQRLREMGARSLRWPGGAELDWLDWKQTVGTTLERGELRTTYNGKQTPVLGLHEFLDLSEELDAAPVLGVNVLMSPDDAADLVEYVLGPVDSAQGALRKRNGRREPWSSATLFEIGNEPTPAYASKSRLEQAGANYARLAGLTSAAMQARARQLGVEIVTSAAVETTMQLAERLPGVSDAMAALLRNWNGQSLDPRSGLGASVKAVHGHFYSYFGHDRDERRHFENLMAAGATLRQTIRTRIEPRVDAQEFWLTEYHVLARDGDEVLAESSKDFQSGLVIADLLMTLIEEGAPVAHVNNLSQWNAFGLLADDGHGWHVRPAGHAFGLLAAAAGERILKLDLKVEGLDGETHRIEKGRGNIPSGLTYDKVSGLATLNADTGKPRVFLLNRDYDDDARVELRVAGHTLGGAQLSRFHHAELTAHNESDSERSAVGITRATLETARSLTVPAHSFVRIDFR